MAATNNGNMPMFLAFALTFGCGLAFSIFIAQATGRRDAALVRRLVGAGIFSFVTLGLLSALPGWFLAPSLLQLLATPSTIMPEALAYARVSFLAAPATMLLLFVQFALRGTGDSLTPLRFVAFGTVMDVALNPLLILGVGPLPRLDVQGSALAGLFSSYVSLVALLCYIYARKLPIGLRGAELRFIRPAWTLLSEVLRRGGPMGLQMIVMTASSLAIMGLVNRHGVQTIAAFGAINQLWIYIQMPGMAIGTAVSTMVAQSIGAGRWDRLDRVALVGIVANTLLTGVVVLSVMLPDRAVLGLFLPDRGTLEIARHINRIATWSYVVAGVMMVLTAVPRAKGAMLVPLLIMTVALIPGRVGFAAAAFSKLGVDALWWSFPVSYAAALPLALAYYRWGGWRSIRLMKSMGGGAGLGGTAA